MVGAMFVMTQLSLLDNFIMLYNSILYYKQPSRFSDFCSNSNNVFVQGINKLVGSLVCIGIIFYIFSIFFMLLRQSH